MTRSGSREPRPQPIAGGPPRWRDLANLAGVLTLARLPLAAVFPFLGGVRWLLVAVYLLGVGTDLLDGIVARWRGLVSQAGALADGVADKAFHLAVAATLVHQAVVPWWWLPLWFTREITQALLLPWFGWRLWRHPALPRHANRPGKATTVLVGVAVVLALVDLDTFALVVTALAGATGLLAAWTYAARELADQPA